ncbi:putative spermidine/putrescine transport system substrate-binding protein [Arboricoccus pini]|uniref:Putative spermidine/putrescine transport system substrate-binding protein n=1 Tax=Arboricoccus pini TaxID=1963835 RepID=A0A212RJN3_9PROT|nr:ABC transporter substrate-binding protein [Arboricoccus pini]SNB72624.1 putative spermidine/putrescine transport system substrate-binding protein [Arboricoccus pini]
MLRLRLRHAATALALALPLLAHAASAEEFTVTSWGGAYQDAQRKAFFEPYTKATGVKLNEDQWSGELAKVRGMVQSGSTSWDLVSTDPKTAELGCNDGLFERLDYSRIGDTADFAKGAELECAFGTDVYATILGYDPTKLKGEAPKSVADIFDTKKFPGKRGLQKVPADNLELALVADGVPYDKVYDVLKTKEGQDRAFKKLDTIKKDVVWWTAGAQPPQMLAAGEVVMTTAWNGRIADANKNGQHFTMVWPNQVQGFDMWVIPTGSKKIDAVYDFLKYYYQPKNLARITDYIAYAPTTNAALKMVSPDILPDLPTAPQNMKGAIVQDPEFWGDYGTELEARFNSWLAN